MLTYTKITFAAAFILTTAPSGFPGAQALASNNYDNPDWTPAYAAPSATYCPALEGYPDCHPDSHASWEERSITSRRPLAGRASHHSRP